MQQQTSGEVVVFIWTSTADFFAELNSENYENWSTFAKVIATVYKSGLTFFLDGDMYHKLTLSISVTYRNAMNLQQFLNIFYRLEK